MIALINMSTWMHVKVLVALGLQVMHFKKGG